MKSIHSPMYLPDIEKMMARSDVGWKGRIEQGFCGIPVANGRFGGPVWERDESTLSIQLNHTDLFMYNDACSHTDARSGAMGRINISFGDPIFSEDTDHHLSLFRGCLSVKGRDMFISVFPDMDRDILYVEIEDKRRNKKPISIEIEMLREQDDIRGKYHAISRFALDDGMMLYQTFEEKSEISVNDFRCDTAVYVLPYYWKRYRQDLDERFLREKAYPFIRGAAEMYRNFYGFQKEADGYYHFHDTNLHEHIWGGWDVIDDHALARGVFAVAIKAAEILHTDDELIIQWQERLAHIAPYPTSLQEGALGYAAEHADGENVWAQGLEPAGFTRAMEGSESPQLKMIDKFDVLNMETRDQGMDGGEWAMAERTYHKMPGYVRLQTNSKLDHGQTSRFLQDIARMGHAEDYERILDYQVSLFPNEPNLIRRGGDYFSAQGYGTFSAAVQQGLCQCLAPRPGMQEVIRVFPSWPEKWDARFKLAAKRGFLASSCMISGEVLYVEVESRLGGTLDIRTPYEKTDVYRNRNYLFSDFGGKNAFLSIETEKNDSIVFVKHEEQTDDSEE